jgi:putative DNA primase/helicase
VVATTVNLVCWKRFHWYSVTTRSSHRQTFLWPGEANTQPRLRGCKGRGSWRAQKSTRETKFDEAKVKLLTGGDKITGRFMRADYTDFTPTHTLFLVGNHQPTISAGGHAFFRRLQLIPFEHRVEEKIDGYHQQMFDAEGPAILAWMVRGAVDVLENGLHVPECVKPATKDYEQNEDSIPQFIDECCQRVSGDFKLPSGVVYQRYVEWCRENGITPKSNSVFGRDLANHRVKVGRSDGKRYVYGLMLDKPINNGYMPK